MSTQANESVEIKKFPSTGGGVIFTHAASYDGLVSRGTTFSLQDKNNSEFVPIQDQSADESFIVKIPFSSLTPDPITDGVQKTSYTVYLHTNTIDTGTSTKTYSFTNNGFYQYITIE